MTLRKRTCICNVRCDVTFFSDRCIGIDVSFSFPSLRPPILQPPSFFLVLLDRDVALRLLGKTILDIPAQRNNT